MTDAPTQPPVRRTERRHRSPHGVGMFVTDAELIEALGVPPDVGRARLAELDMKGPVYAFPKKQKEWGDRRYRPAVEAWFEQRYGLKIGSPNIRRVS